MLALHLIAAFAVAAALVLYSVLVFSGRRMQTLEETRTLFRLAPVGGVLVAAGMVLVFVLGVILALDSDTFDLWDGWIIAAIVLWALATGLGGRTGREYMAGMKKAEELQSAGQTGPSAELVAINRTQRGVVMHALASMFTLLILIDMIWKPGA
jgi:protein-S-isoprenylcysteine O-methyltransferase Ste14